MNLTWVGHSTILLHHILVCSNYHSFNHQERKCNGKLKSLRIYLEFDSIIGKKKKNKVKFFMDIYTCLYPHFSPNINMVIVRTFGCVWKRGRGQGHMM